MRKFIFVLLLLPLISIGQDSKYPSYWKLGWWIPKEKKLYYSISAPRFQSDTLKPVYQTAFTFYSDTANPIGSSHDDSAIKFAIGTYDIGGLKTGMFTRAIGPNTEFIYNHMEPHFKWMLATDTLLYPKSLFGIEAGMAWVNRYDTIKVKYCKDRGILNGWKAVYWQNGYIIDRPNTINVFFDENMNRIYGVSMYLIR